MLTDPPPSHLPQRVGRYRVVRELGKGAMGRVLLCHDPVLDRQVAVKHLRADLQIAPEQREPLVHRMRQEARASARVSHPNLVALHDMGEDPNVGLYLVFEYVEGTTLKERLQRGPLGPEDAAALARQLGGALHMAHTAGVVHRDVKPENVMLSATGAKVADFGIARIPDSTLTQGGSILGTPAYSAPEAVRGSRFSPKSDQFSLAATLYEAISGRRAFPGDDAVAVATLITNEEPPAISAVCNLDPSVDTVLARALAKHPNSRFEDCEQFGRALSAALSRGARTAIPTMPDTYHVQQSQRSGLFGMAIALLLGAAGAWLILRDPDSSQAPSAIVDSARAAPIRDEEILPIAWLAERPARPTPKRRVAPEPAAHRDQDAGAASE